MSDDILHSEYAAEIAAEEARVERVCTAQELWEAGYLCGLAQAGLRSQPGPAYRDWLLARAEAGGR